MLSSKYNNLLDYYEKYKDRPWKEWLIFDGILNKPSKQGMLGFFKKKLQVGDKVFYTKRNTVATITKVDTRDSYYDIELETGHIINTVDDFLKPLEEDNCKYVFKLSQYTNYLAYNELLVMQGLKEVSKYCPHFLRGIGIIKAKVEPKYRKIENPFDIKSKYPIEKELLLCEFLDKSEKFYNYIKSEKIHEDVLYSIVKQVLMAICIAQKETRFTHYDLHSNNVMVRKCNKDLVFLYKLDDENQFCVPSLGYIHKIIDYGFSYIKDMEDGPLYSSLCHTDVGFISDRFDWVSDPKLFLVTVSDEIKDMRRTKKSKKFRRIVKNIFSPLKIDWDSGWDNTEKKGAVDYVAELLESYNTSSRLFEDCDYYCLDLFQSLIILPLEPQDYSNIRTSYETFLSEWIKIENEISNEFYNLYILKELVDVARTVRPEYLQTETREFAVTEFRNKLYETLRKVSAFCVPKNIHFEKLLCSMYVFSKNIEGMLYEIIEKRIKKKNLEYDKMLLK